MPPNLMRLVKWSLAFGKKRWLAGLALYLISKVYSRYFEKPKSNR